MGGERERRDDADEPIEGTATEEAGSPAAQQVERYAENVERLAMMPRPAPAPTLAVAPRVKAEDLVARLEVIQQAAETAMKDGVDFGTIPGTDKPTLLKPGAEKLGVLFELDIQIDNQKIWEPPHLTVVSHATVFHVPTGTRLGYGEGICSTREKKYAKRLANRKCPDCEAEAILRSRNEGEGWFCWRKRGGCGNQFAADDDRITRQEVGEIENPNLPDTWNTVVKIAEKRARVDAVLAVTGASALFTQDVEDLPAEDRPQGKSAEDLKSKGAGKRSGASSGGKPAEPTANMKRAATRLINQKIPEALRDELRSKVGPTQGEFGKLISNLKRISDTGDNLPAFFNAYGITYTPASDVPADTSDLDAEAKAEAEAIADAQGEEPDAVERALGVPGDDDK